MDIFQLIGIGLAGAVTAVILKQTRPEFALAVTLATGGVLLCFIITGLGTVAREIQEVVELGGIDNKYFTALIKIIGVSYITEIASELCRDAGAGAIAVKLEMVGKVFIMILSLPIIKGFLEVCINAIHML